jgi:hypothetical protein
MNRIIPELDTQHHILAQLFARLSQTWGSQFGDRAYKPHPCALCMSAEYSELNL